MAVIIQSKILIAILAAVTAIAAVLVSFQTDRDKRTQRKAEFAQKVRAYKQTEPAYVASPSHAARSFRMP